MKFVITTLTLVIIGCGRESGSPDQPKLPDTSDISPQPDQSPEENPDQQESPKTDPCAMRQMHPNEKPLDFENMELPSGVWRVSEPDYYFVHYRPSRCPDKPIIVDSYDYDLYIVPESKRVSRGRETTIQFSSFTRDDIPVNVHAKRVESGLFCGEVRHQEGERTIAWERNHGPPHLIEDLLEGIYGWICAGEEIQLRYLDNINLDRHLLGRPPVPDEGTKPRSRI